MVRGVGERGEGGGEDLYPPLPPPLPLFIVSRDARLDCRVGGKGCKV